MSSTDFVDFSVRQNKVIERSIVFDGVKKISDVLNLTDQVLVGFGSVWFVDFDIAHRALGIQTMVSIESDQIISERAEFNKPYRTIEVIEGMSYDVIPDLLVRPDLATRPWLVWLDYDQALDETMIDELRLLVSELPDNSILLTTFNASPGRYNPKPVGRLDSLLDLFGDAFPIENFEMDINSPIPKRLGAHNETKIVDAISVAVSDLLRSHAITIARPGGFTPAFSLRYRDGSPMVTVGGVLSSVEAKPRVENLISSRAWLGQLSDPIETPPLTMKEVAALRTLLPSDTALNRTEVRKLGFDLKDEQIDSFSAHYLRYPSFVQTAR